MTGRHKKWFPWLPVALLCLVIFVQSGYPSPDMGPSFPLQDKVLHLAVYGVLAFLFARACRLTWPGYHSRHVLLLVSVGFTTLYGLSDEFHQSLVAARQAEFLDVVADFAGGVMGAGVYLQWRDRRDRADKQ